MRFVMMDATGNRLLLVDGRQRPGLNWAELARWTAQHDPQGSHDGLLALLDSEAAAARMRMFNPDGSEDMCGNGVRAVGAYLLADRTPGTEVALETLAGVRRARLVGNSPQGPMVRAEIGPAQVTPAPHPATPLGDALEALVGDSALVRVGTPHLVVPALADWPRERWGPDSAALETGLLPGERVTVSWFAREGPGALRARFWERAVGETLSCGTGAAAILAAARQLGLADGEALLRTSGGELRVEQDEPGVLYVTGPVQAQCPGDWPRRWPGLASEPAADPA